MQKISHVTRLKRVRNNRSEVDLTRLKGLREIVGLFHPVVRLCQFVRLVSTGPKERQVNQTMLTLATAAATY